MKKVFLMLILSVLVIAAFAVPASAAPNLKADLPTEGVMSSDPLYGASEETTAVDSSDTNVGAAATSGLIMKGACTISNVGNGSVQIHGYTQTYSSVSSVKVNVYLQKWTGTAWVDVMGITNLGSSTDYLSASKTITVTSGYYYRTRAVHTATSGTSSETTNSTTSYIYI